MDILLKSIGVLCITAYIMGLLTNLIPLGYTQKAIRLTVAIYIITSVFIPLKNFEFDVNYNRPDTEDYNAQTQAYILEETKNYIEKNISQQLEVKSISYNSVEVHIHKQSEGFEIANVCIYGVPPEQQQLTQNILSLGERIVFGV